MVDDGRSRRQTNLRNALEPIADSSKRSVHLEAMSKAIFSPFQRKRGEDSSKILTDLAPVIMTPRMINSVAASSSKPRSAVNGMGSGHMDLVSLGRAPMKFGAGISTRRITSTDLQITEATDELLSAEVPEPDGLAGDVSLLRGFNATMPSATRGKARRRQTRAVGTPRLGLKKLSVRARGLLTEAEQEQEHDSSASEEDAVVVNKRGKRRGRTRESLGASVTLGKEELIRQQEEILRDRENLHVRRALITSEIDEIARKVNALDAVRSQLESDLLKLKEDELELNDELEGVQERMEFEAMRTTAARRPTVDQSSRRRKGPAFLPSEHDDLPPGVAFITIPLSGSVTALDFSEPYGTLVAVPSSSSGPRSDDTCPGVWDLLTVSEVGRLEGHNGAVKCLQVEDHVCLTGGEDGSIRVWDLRRVGEDADTELVNLTDIEEEGEETEGTSIINGIQQAPKDVGTGGPCTRILEGHSKAVSALYFEDNCLVTGASDKTLRQWDLTTGQCVLTMDILWALAHPPRSSSSPFSSGFVPGTATAALGTFAVPTPPAADGSWDMYTDFVGGVQFWGYGLVSGSGDGAVRMWDMRTGQAHRTLSGHTAPVTCLQFDQLHVVSGSLDKTIRIWDIRTGGIFETIKFDHGVTALQFDTRKIVAAAGENGVKVYNRTTLQSSTLNTNGHTKPVEHLRYMDRYLVSGGKDAQLKIWAL